MLNASNQGGMCGTLETVHNFLLQCDLYKQGEMFTAICKVWQGGQQGGRSPWWEWRQTHTWKMENRDRSACDLRVEYEAWCLRQWEHNHFCACGYCSCKIFMHTATGEQCEWLASGALRLAKVSLHTGRNFLFLFILVKQKYVKLGRDIPPIANDWWNFLYPQLA